MTPSTPRLFSPIITPFNREGGLDKDSLFTLFEQLTLLDISPILFTKESEVDQLTTDEVIEIAKLISARNSGEDRVFTGLNLFSTNLRFNLELSKLANELNFDFVTIDPTSFFSEEIGTYLYIKQILDQSKKPVAVNIDKFPLSTASKIAEHSNLLAFMTDADFDQIGPIVNFTNAPSLISTNIRQFPNINEKKQSSLFTREAIIFPNEIKHFFDQTQKQMIDGEEFFFMRKQIAKMAPFKGPNLLKMILFQKTVTQNSVMRLPWSELDLPTDSLIEELIHSFDSWFKSKEN